MCGEESSLWFSKLLCRFILHFVTDKSTEQFYSHSELDLQFLYLQLYTFLFI